MEEVTHRGTICLLSWWKVGHDIDWSGYVREEADGTITFRGGGLFPKNGEFIPICLVPNKMQRGLDRYLSRSRIAGKSYEEVCQMAYAYMAKHMIHWKVNQD